MRTATIASMICDVIETHQDTCDNNGSGREPVTHVVSETDQESANIDELRTSGLDGRILMLLDNGETFRITISKEAADEPADKVAALKAAQDELSAIADGNPDLVSSKVLDQIAAALEG